jgi:propanol-preferring alcohol dehydrogenase
MDPFLHSTIPALMPAMVLDRPGSSLRLEQRPVPVPGPGQLLVKVGACGVCRTDLHIIDGEITPHRMPLVPGHEIVGTVAAVGAGVRHRGVGERVGAFWLASACGHCRYCHERQENLCDAARFTGFDNNGGFAAYAVVNGDFVCQVPARYDDAHAAPLLCAGLIGYRAYKMAGFAERVGLYGFGAAAHLLTQLALVEQREIYAFTRSDDRRSRQFALELGAHWAGGVEEQPPVPLDAALLFAPAGDLVIRALAAVRKGGTVICAGIHMSDIPTFAYALLWGERCLRSVANLTRADAEDFIRVAERIPLHPRVRVFPLSRANEAIGLMRQGLLEGAAVLVP